MKYALIFLSFLLLDSCLNNNDSEQYIDDTIIHGVVKGKVHIYSEFTYQAINILGEIEKGERLGFFAAPMSNVIKKYDENGKLIEASRYTSSGHLITKKLYYYDERGNRISEEDNASSIYSKIKYKYNSKDSLIEKIYFNPDGSAAPKEIYNYNENNNLIEEIFYDGNKEIISKTSYKYDEKDNIVEEIFHYEDNKIRKRVFEYDENDNVIKRKVSFSGEPGMDGTTIYKYDDNDNKIEEIHYNIKNDLGMKFTSKYNEDGKRIETKGYNSDGSLDYKSYEKYDKYGNTIEEIHINSDETIERKEYEYEYDDIGNWIKRIYYENDDPKSIIERNIEYYE